SWLFMRSLLSYAKNAGHAVRTSPHTRGEPKRRTRECKTLDARPYCAIVNDYLTSNPSRLVDSQPACCPPTDTGLSSRQLRRLNFGGDKANNHVQGFNSGAGDTYARRPRRRGRVPRFRGLADRRGQPRACPDGHHRRKPDAEP